MADTRRLTLRLSPELYHLLVERAATDHRSLNREIEYLLWQMFQSNADAFAHTRRSMQPIPSSTTTPRPSGGSQDG